MNARGAQPCLDLGCIGGAIQLQIASQVAAPARVGAEEQAGKLAQLRLPPLQIKMHWPLPQFGRSPHRCFQPNLTGVGQIQVHICARRLATKAQPPLARFLLPKERSVETSEYGSFSASFLMLMREFVASR